MEDNDQFLREIQDDFLTEANDLLEAAEEYFLGFENDPTNISFVDKIFRLFHTVKGTAAAAEFMALNHFTHTVENLLSQLKKQEVSPTKEVIQILFECNDQLRSYILTLKADRTSSVDTSELENKIKLIIQNKGYLNDQVPVEETSASTNNDLSQSTENLSAQQESFVPSDGIYESASSYVQPEVSDNESFEQLSGSSNSAVAFSKTIDPASGQSEFTEKSNFVSKTPSAPSSEKGVDKQAVAGDEIIKLPLSKIDDLLNLFGEQVIFQSVLDHARVDPKTNWGTIDKTIAQANGERKGLKI